MIKTIITGMLLLICVAMYSSYLYYLNTVPLPECIRRCAFSIIALSFIISAKCSEWIGCSSELCKDIQRIFWFSLISVFTIQIIHYSLHIENVTEKLLIFNGAIIIYAVGTIGGSIRRKAYR